MRIAVCGLAMAVSMASACAQDFAGKTITVSVGFGPGNRVDLYGRILGPILARNLPGQPNIVVMNRPGAGGVTAMADWAVRSEPNGLSIAIGAQTQLDPDALIRTKARYEPAKFRYIGGLAGPSQGLMINKDAMARLTNKSAPPVTMGIVGSSLRTGNYQVLWGAAFLGWNVKWVQGYRETSEMRQALERGEIDMTSFGSSTDIDFLLSTGKFAVASQSGTMIDGKPVTRPVFGAAPVMARLVENKITDAAARKAFEYAEYVIQVGMYIVLPPGTADNIVSLYVKAFEAAVKDPKYQAEWARIDPDSPIVHRADLEKLADNLSRVSPETLEFIQAELKRQGFTSP